MYETKLPCKTLSHFFSMNFIMLLKMSHSRPERRFLDVSSKTAKSSIDHMNTLNSQTDYNHCPTIERPKLDVQVKTDTKIYSVSYVLAAIL